MSIRVWLRHLPVRLAMKAVAAKSIAYSTSKTPSKAYCSVVEAEVNNPIKLEVAADRSGSMPRSSNTGASSIPPATPSAPASIPVNVPRRMTCTTSMSTKPALLVRLLYRRTADVCTRQITTTRQSKAN